tara:strand:- start:289 stop:420 length:132 start_codon:yes stop_codon:yes gene_type:complete
MYKKEKLSGTTFDGKILPRFITIFSMAELEDKNIAYEKWKHQT